MESRREMFRFFFLSAAASLGGMGIARRAFGALEEKPLGEFYSAKLDPDFLEFPERPPLSVSESFEDMVLAGETHRVHRIHMHIRDGVDRHGGMAVLFDIPEGRAFMAPEGVKVVPRGRRIILPLFEFDRETGYVVGEERHDQFGNLIAAGEGESLESRFAAVVEASRTNGFDMSPGYREGYGVWITQTAPGSKHMKHAMAYLPYRIALEDIHLIVPLRMVKADIRKT